MPWHVVVWRGVTSRHTQDTSPENKAHASAKDGGARQRSQPPRMTKSPEQSHRKTVDIIQPNLLQNFKTTVRQPAKGVKSHTETDSTQAEV